MADSSIPEPETLIAIEVERLVSGAYRGWWRGWIGPGTFLTPGPGDQVVIQCASREVFDNWCKGIQRNAVLQRSAMAPGDLSNAIVTLWADTLGNVAPAYMPAAEEVDMEQGGTVLAGVSNVLDAQAASRLIACWALAWLEDLHEEPVGTPGTTQGPLLH